MRTSRRAFQCQHLMLMILRKLRGEKELSWAPYGPTLLLKDSLLAWKRCAPDPHVAVDLESDF